MFYNEQEFYLFDLHLYFASTKNCLDIMSMILATQLVSVHFHFLPSPRCQMQENEWLARRSTNSTRPAMASSPLMMFEESMMSRWMSQGNSFYYDWVVFVTNSNPLISILLWFNCGRSWRIIYRVSQKKLSLVEIGSEKSSRSFDKLWWYP